MPIAKKSLSKWPQPECGWTTDSITTNVTLRVKTQAAFVPDQDKALTKPDP